MDIRKIYDISQPVFGCEVYPGDTVPEKRPVFRMEEGSLYNLTDFSMGAHNGTHADAPLHFLREGKGIGELPAEKFVGPAYVAALDGPVTAADAEAVLKRAAAAYPGAEKRILLKGRLTVTPEAAAVFAGAGIHLLGNESQSVGPENAPMAVHLALLRAETVLLEGIRLQSVPEGAYFCSCMPLNLAHTDGAPCRAILIDCL